MNKEMRDRLRMLTNRAQRAGSKLVMEAPATILSLLDCLDALEEKERALEWLFTGRNGAARFAVLSVGDKYGVYVNGLLKGSGPTPLAAVLDAMKMERK